ncbi:MAG: LysR family transcriptional regulator, partial [Myxococcota bacterium]
MNRDALRALVEIVELGSLVAASRRLGVPRPTLRRRLDELEAEVGVSLLVRTRSGSVPTEAGRLLAKRGRDLLRDEAAALAEAREVAEEPRGSLELVIPVGMAAPPVAALMFSLRERYPKLVVRIRTSENPVASLEKEIDVA